MQEHTLCQDQASAQSMLHQCVTAPYKYAAGPVFPQTISAAIRGVRLRPQLQSRLRQAFADNLIGDKLLLAA